ncbi:hypothetical protein RZS28_17980 [Methylocapsa polymorpha]|uniref:Uncharacterized protein n=1 Tax=Methylocapsa polymorpha TaxID=3080828 RepID=A0ABZ0HQS5_9HYPH|nr:hypothetical protein RZS28_17980 [Methylocapsa sp. RX1]
MSFWLFGKLALAGAGRVKPMQSEKLSIRTPKQDCGLNLCFVLNIDKLLGEIGSVRTNCAGALLAS